MMTDVALVDAGLEAQSPDIETLRSSDPMQPGQYWRCVQEHDGHEVGLVYLLMAIRTASGQDHSVRLCTHPRESRNLGYRDVLMGDFLSKFEPAPDGAQIRQREQQDIMAQVTAQQQKLLALTNNPRAQQEDEELREQIQIEIERAEREELAQVQAAAQSREKTEQDLRRIHRRAARRSQAAGNPLAVRSTLIGSNVSGLINAQVTDDALGDLKAEAVRRGAIATATSKWLQAQTREIQSTIEQLTPYLSEAAEVAKAQASGALQRANDIAKGLTSLGIYTGSAVTVVSVVEGAPATSNEPLTLLQAKRYMDEELVVWEDIPDSFDYASASLFFKHLAENKSLRDQMMPTQRCVVSIAVTRRSISYEKIDAAELQRRLRANRDLFLLVRNGENIHAVYSDEPTHEMSPRLFPSTEDISRPFKGMDGTKIALQDLSYPDRAESFERMRLSYVRFLILLCGLDHRLKLLGDFYPPEQSLQFISEEFQSKYMRFVHDDDAQWAIADNREPLKEWYLRQSSYVQSGSRVILSPAAVDSCPQAIRRSARLRSDALWTPLIAREERGNLYVTVNLEKRWSDDTGNGKVWLSGPDAKKGGGVSWLCIDRAKLGEVERFIQSRQSRAQGDIVTLRTLVRAQKVLKDDAHKERELRQYLREQMRHVQLPGLEFQDEIDRAIATWRAANRGADAPQVAETAKVNAICTVLFPAQALSQLVSDQVRDMASCQGIKPIRLCRTGKAQLVLYAQTPLDHPKRAGHPSVLQWGWVSRYKVQESKGTFSLGASTLEWLMEGKVDASEDVVAEYEALAPYLRGHEEPDLDAALAHCASAQEWADRWPKLVEHWRAYGEIEPSILSDFVEQATAALKGEKYWPILYITIPVALRQPMVERGNLGYRFTSVSMHFMRLLMKCASAEQLKVVSDYFARLGWGRAMKNQLTELSSLGGKIDTRIAEGLRAHPGVVPRHELPDPPSWAALDSHGKGGVLRKRRRIGYFNREENTRAYRRSQGGLPTHEQTKVALSLNRAFDRLMDRGQFNKKLVLAALREEIAKERNWAFANENTHDKVRKIEEKMKEVKAGKPNGEFVSALVWDEQAGRSHACRMVHGLYAVDGGEAPQESNTDDQQDEPACR